MKNLSLMDSAMPKTKPDDYDKAMALIEGAFNPKATKRNLQQLREVATEVEKARKSAEAWHQAAEDREKAAQSAEGAATKARQALVEESDEARTALGTREALVAKREADADERDELQDERATDLKRREGLLRQAGVAGL